MKLNELKEEMLEKCNIDRNNPAARALFSNFMLSTHSKLNNTYVKKLGISEKINNFDLTEEEANKIKAACCFEFGAELPLSEAVSMVQKEEKED